MSQTLTQSQDAQVIVVLSKDNVPVTGLAFGDVTVQYRKTGGSFVTKTLLIGDWTEIGDGVYEIDYTAAELNTVGTFITKVTGADIDQSVTISQIVAASAGASTSISLDTCVLSGHIADPSGNAIEGATVSARLIGRPSIEQNAAALTDDLVTAKTDANGEFFLPLVRLAEVEIFIPEANYRRRLTVPNSASVNLFSMAAA